MNVVVLHTEDGDTIAVVDSTEMLSPHSFTEVHEDDRDGYLKTLPEQQLALQRIFKGVLSLFGIQVGKNDAQQN